MLNLADPSGNTAGREVVRQVQARFALHESRDMDEGTGVEPPRSPQELAGEPPALHMDEGTGVAPPRSPQELAGEPPALRMDEGTGVEPPRSTG